MRKALIIAKREYLSAVRSKLFVITLVLMPILMGGSIGFQVLLKDHVNVSDKHFAIVDHGGQLYDVLAGAMEQRNKEKIFEHDAQHPDAAAKQTRPRFILERVPTDPDPLKQGLALSDRVRDGELEGFLEIGAAVVEAGEGADGQVRYHSPNPIQDEFRQWAGPVLNDYIRAQRLERAGLDADQVARVTQWVDVNSLDLLSMGESGEIQEAQESNELASIFVPFGMVMLLFMVVTIGAAPLTQTVLEEKMGRIAEVLLGSISPFQLMLGKLIGSVAVSITIVGVYMLGAYFALDHYGYAGLIPTENLPWLFGFQALAVIMFGAMFIAIGAACTELKEVQSAMMPVWLVICIPMFVLGPVLKEPNSAFAVGLSLFPPATPMLMILRQSIPPGIPTWQPVLGMVLVLLTTVAVVFAGGRIFRVGLLMQGKGAKFGEMLRWVVRG